MSAFESKEWGQVEGGGGRVGGYGNMEGRKVCVCVWVGGCGCVSESV